MKHINTYSLLEAGPDNLSTYAECWGSRATSPGRPLMTGTYEEVTEALDKLGHQNVVIIQLARQGVARKHLHLTDFRRLVAHDPR